MPEFDESEGRWVTINGTHIFIQAKDGSEGRTMGGKTSGRHPSFVKKIPKTSMKVTEQHTRLVEIYNRRKSEISKGHQEIKEIHKRMIAKDKEYEDAKKTWEEYHDKPDFSFANPEMNAEYNRLWNVAHELNLESSKISQEAIEKEKEIGYIRESIRKEAREYLFPQVAPATSHAVPKFYGLSHDQELAATEATRMFNVFCISPTTKDVTIVSTDQDRSYSSLGGIALTPLAGTETAWHEYGHVIEYNDRVIQDDCKKFLNDRCVGEKLQKLADLHPHGGFRQDEYTRVDKWLDDYAGKDYSFGATEILSMGMQLLYEKPIEFALKDPEHFNFTIRKCKNIYEKKPRKKRTVKPKSAKTTSRRKR